MASINGLDPALLLQNAQQDSLARVAKPSQGKSRFTPDEEAGIRQQAKRFEAIFMKMVVDSMRKNVEQSDLFSSESDPSRGIYQGMLDSEYSQSMVGAQNFGLADSMMRQFGVEPKEGGESMPSALSQMLGTGRSAPAWQKTLFQAPVRGAVSSDFGPRQDPIDGAPREHQGIDIAVPVGATVQAAAAGTVVFAGERAGYGKVVEVDHRNGYRTLYGHLDSLSVSAGDTVRQGAELAKSGSTGRSTGPHLHFEVRVNGEAVDPTDFVRLGR